jgi:hypothetical protein
MRRQELLADIRAGRERFDAALARVAPGRMLEPAFHAGWSVKDMLAHVGWWEQRCVDVYHTLLRNETPDPAWETQPDDEVNIMVYRDNLSRSLAEVRRNERNAYLALVSIVETAPEADLFDPQRFAWLEGRTLAEWIAGSSAEHYDEHLPTLLAWLDRS